MNRPEYVARELSKILAPHQIDFTDSTRDEYSQSLSGDTRIPLGIVFPENEQSVLEIVKLANRIGTELYPISRGKNFGYGAALGSRPGQLIVDLRNMNEILEVNEGLAFVRLQPGVSQQQLFERLSSTRLQMDATGAGPSASIVGNVLERGFGHTEYGDRFAHIINMRVVLPNESVIQTGYGGLESDSKALNTYRYGLGPCLDGLFTQSNFGIVTELCLELMPRPEYRNYLFFSAYDEQDLTRLVVAVRELKLQGVLNTAVHIANPARAGATKKEVGAWIFSSSISGCRSVVKAKTKQVRQSLSHIKGKLKTVSPAKLKLLEFWHNKLKSTTIFPAVKMAVDLLNGKPSIKPIQDLAGTDRPISADPTPSDFAYGYRWINAVCPANECAEELYRIISSSELKHGLRLTFTFVNPRTIVMISDLQFAKSESEQLDSVKSQLEACYSELQASGFLPYRIGIHDKNISSYKSITRTFLNEIKVAIDSKAILAPEKYAIL